MNDSSESYIYTGADGERVPENARNIEYDAGITTIKEHSLRNNGCITSVVLPNSITVIDDRAYYCCDNLKHLRLSSSLQSIGVESFEECSSITRLELPSALHTVKKNGFRNCHSLRAIAPQSQHETLSLKTIEEWAFYHCEKLTSITNLTSLETIGRAAFYSCCNLTSIPYLPSLVTIGPNAFCRCTFLTKISLGPSIKSAARDSFDECYSLVELKCTYRTHTILPWKVTHVTVDPNTTRIHTSAFAGCYQLHSISLTSSVTLLDPSCFWGCKKLPAGLMMSNTVKHVGIGAFARSEINSVNLPPHAMQDVYTFVGGEGEKAPPDVERVVVHETVRVIEEDYFINCLGVTYLKISSKSITLKSDAFWSSKKIREIEFHAKATFNIGKDAFYQCAQLELSKVKWPKIMKWIVEGNFDVKKYLRDLQPIPIMHEYPFCCSRNPQRENSELHEYCKTYHRLSKCWIWIIIRELKRKKVLTNKRKHQSFYQNRICECLCNEDMDILKLVRKVDPVPRNLVDAIIDDLHSFDIVFNKVPRDLVWKVIEFIL